MIVEAVLPAARERLITVGDAAPLVDAARLLRDLEADLVRQIGHCQGASCMAAASAVMTRAVLYCRPDDLLSDVWSRMKERHLKNVPILDPDSRPVGVLNARDALESLLEELEYQEILLRDYVMCVGYH